MSRYLSLLEKYIAKISFENRDAKKLWGGVQISISWPLFANLVQHNTWCEKVLGRIFSLQKNSLMNSSCWNKSKEYLNIIYSIYNAIIWMCFVFMFGIIIIVVTHLLYTCYRLNMTSCMKKCTSVAWKNGPVQLIRRYIPLLYLLYSFFFHWYWCFSCTLKLVMNSGLRNEWETLQFFKPFMGVKCLKYRGL